MFHGCVYFPAELLQFAQNYMSQPQCATVFCTINLLKCDGTCSVSFVMPSILHFNQRLYSFHWQLFF